MKASYKLSRLAEQDVSSIAQYIAQDDLDSAIYFTEEVERVCGLIAIMPEIGSSISFIKTHQFHYFPAGHFQKYLIFYHTANESVEIVRVLHKRRDIESLFDENGIEHV